MPCWVLERCGDRIPGGHPPTRRLSSGSPGLSAPPGAWRPPERTASQEPPIFGPPATPPASRAAAPRGGQPPRAGPVLTIWNNQRLRASSARGPYQLLGGWWGAGRVDLRGMGRGTRPGGSLPRLPPAGGLVSGGNVRLNRGGCRPWNTSNSTPAARSRFCAARPRPKTSPRAPPSWACPPWLVLDRDGVYGAPRFFAAAREHGLRPIVGAELTMEDDTVLPVLVENRTGYRNLCRLISRAQLRGTKAEHPVRWDELPEFAGGLVCLTGDEEGPLFRALLFDDRGRRARGPAPPAGHLRSPGSVRGVAAAPLAHRRPHPRGVSRAGAGVRRAGSGDQRGALRRGRGPAGARCA